MTGTFPSQQPSNNPVGWVRQSLGRYFQFSGRARRREYWFFVLFSILAGLVGALIDAILGLGSEGGGPVNGLVSLALLIPGLTVGVRRLHDTGRSGWWMLLVLLPVIGTIVLIVFFVLKGEPGANRFGPPPPDYPLEG